MPKIKPRKALHKRKSCPHDWAALYLESERARDVAGLPDVESPAKALARPVFRESAHQIAGPVLSEAELEAHDIIAFTRSYFGGTRTIAPYKLGKKTEKTVFVHPSTIELPPVVHAPKPEPVATRALAIAPDGAFFDIALALIDAQEARQALRDRHIAERERQERKVRERQEYRDSVRDAQRNKWINALGYA